MLNKTVDLTRLCMVKEIQHILEECDYDRGGFILQIPSYKQQLIEYILSNINHRYLEIHNLTQIPKEAIDVIPQCPIDEIIVIKQLLYMGISNIVQELSNQINIEVKSA